MNGYMSPVSLGAGGTAFKPADFVDLLCARSRQQPDALAYTLLDGSTPATSLTYLELDRQARSIGALLQENNLAGEPVILLYPPGLEHIAAFFGCLYAAAIAVPTCPIKRPSALRRLEVLAADARAKAIITVEREWSRMNSMFTENPSSLQRLGWFTTDNLEGYGPDNWRMPHLTGTSIAFLQYTSGSTGTPRGVVLSHENLLHNSAQLQSYFGYNNQSRCVSWLPPYHDMGLIGGILQPLYGGYPCALMSPASFLQSPLRWLQTITQFKATISGGPNFAYELCLRKITDAQRSELDLSNWEVAFNGAEPVRIDTMERFAEAFSSCGFRYESFYPCYGLAEATLIVTGGQKGLPPVTCEVGIYQLTHHKAEQSHDAEGETRILVSCGTTRADQAFAIVDPATELRCRPGEVGEIWVTGASIARGYWRRAEETAAVFNNYLPDSDAGPFLRTGDLGFIQADQLFVTGRLKDLIIIRGLNHYPEDIEETVQRCHEALRSGSGAAFTIDEDGEERVVVHEIAPHAHRQADEVSESIRRAVSEEHLLEVQATVLIRRGTLPKTTSGKIQRTACRTAFLRRNLQVVAEWRRSPRSESTIADDVRPSLQSAAEVESWLTAYFSANTGQEQIDVDRAITYYGLDSLAALELAHKIETRTGVLVSIAKLLGGVSVRGLTQEISALRSTAEPSLGQATFSEPAFAGYPLSRGQQSVWFLHHLSPFSAAYNIASAVRVRSRLDLAALHRAFQALTNRHPALRTSFFTEQGTARQRVHDQMEVLFQKWDASGWTRSELDRHLTAEAHRPFDLKKDRLLRVHLYEQPGPEYVILLVMHHIISDLWSLAVMLRDLEVLYIAEKTGQPASLPALRLTSKDCVEWQERMLSGERGEELWSYWRTQLSGDLPVVDLPADRPRPVVQTYCGSTRSFKVDRGLTQELRVLGQARGATLYMVLLAAFQTLLHRYTNQEKFLVGSPTAGRNRAQLADLVGYFVNPVVLKADFSGSPTFSQYLARVRETTLSAFEHQDYPFSLLVERLKPQFDPARSPLFQVCFTMQGDPLHMEKLSRFAAGDEGASRPLGDVVLESLRIDQRISQFDLMLTIAETDDGLAGSFQYNTDLFDADSIVRMQKNFLTLLEGIVWNAEQPISKLPLLDRAEREQVLVQWNQTDREYGEGRCIHELFEEQVARTPEAVAVMYEAEQLSYRELNERANQLAHHLRGLGVGPEVLVGICMERSLEMVDGLLGILKAGGAYLPLDPSYPLARLSFMLEDAQAPVLLTQASLRESLPAHETKVVCVDSAAASLAAESSENLVGVVGPAQLAYVIYTSGSTGRPKGVMIPHASICNRVQWMCARFGFSAGERILQKTALSFDASIWELFVPLVSGAQLVLARAGLQQDSQELVAQVKAAEISVLQLVPSMLRYFLAVDGVGEGRRSLRWLFCGGEVLSEELVGQVEERLGVKLYNLYGPTEVAIDATYWECGSEAAEGGRVRIGKPLENVQVYILDQEQEGVGVGGVGER